MKKLSSIRRRSASSEETAAEPEVDWALPLGVGGLPTARSATVNEGLRLLKAGAALMKYGRQGQPHATTLTLAQDERSLSWLGHGGTMAKLKGKGSGARTVQMEDVLELWVGHQSEIFQRHIHTSMTSGKAMRDALASGKQTLAGPHVSFSLLLKSSLPAPPDEDGLGPPAAASDRETLDLSCDDEEQFGLCVAALRALLSERAKVDEADHLASLPLPILAPLVMPRVPPQAAAGAAEAAEAAEAAQPPAGPVTAVAEPITDEQATSMLAPLVVPMQVGGGGGGAGAPPVAADAAPSAFAFMNAPAPEGEGGSGEDEDEEGVDEDADLARALAASALEAQAACVGDGAHATQPPSAFAFMNAGAGEAAPPPQQPQVGAEEEQAEAEALACALAASAADEESRARQQADAEDEELRRAIAASLATSDEGAAPAAPPEAPLIDFGS